MGVVVMGPNAHQQSCLPGLARDRSESPPRLVASGSKEEARKRSKYRLASTFELSDEQPKTIRPRARSVPRHGLLDANSHDRLFGQPTPAIVRKLRRIEMGREDGRKVNSKKPLPVDPLTGAVLGKQERQIPCPPPGRMVRTKSLAAGLHTKLW